MRKRVVIIGNSGSGKTFLGQELADISGAQLVHLDAIFWMPGGFSEKRPAADVSRLIAHHKSAPDWIVEGVFGELAVRFLDSAALLLWLDVPWELCRGSLLQRGSESSRQRDPAHAEVRFKDLLQWASEYWTRTDARSHMGHAKMFEDFTGAKVRFECRTDIDSFIQVQKQSPNNEGSIAARRWLSSRDGG